MSDRLTRRERETMAATASGANARQIGGALGISHRTVEIYRANAVAKLGANNIVHAAVLFDRGAGNRETPA